VEQYIVTAKKLNKRKFPVSDFSDKSNIAGQVLKDFTFQGEEATNLTNTLGKWIKDRDGYYYWGGGVIRFPNELKSNNMNGEINWHILQLGINKIWEKTKGEQISIAIIDSGLTSKHPDINYDKIILKRNFLYQGEDEVQKNNVEDIIGHGTHCTGIIAAQGIRSYGVAPNVNLLIGKIADSLDDINQDILFRAIEWAYNNDADIISVSIAIDDFNTNYFKQIEEFNKNKKGILIGALSNVGDQGYNVTGYPFSLGPCLGVGASDKGNKISENTARSTSLDILAPGDKIYSTWLNAGYKIESGCSMAAPIVAGIIALVLSYKSKPTSNIAKEEILKLIKTQTKNFANYKTLPDTFYPIISPTNIFDSL
jgi:major intracellular serine protease